MTFLDFLKAIVFGIVEGITEWLPISSTGHMILLDRIMPLNVSADFKELFLVVIQLGAVMAVVLLYWHRLWPLYRSRKTGKMRIRIKTIDMWFKVLVGCVPAAVIGILWDDLFESLFYNYVCVAIALIVFGVLFILVERRNTGLYPNTESIAEMTYKTAFIIGMFQVLAAIFPGTSRSGATILGAILIGVSRKCAAEYTFFMAVPVMFGASLLKLVKLGFHCTFAEAGTLLIAMFVAFVVSVLAIRYLLSYIKKHDFTMFGIYRIILGIIVLRFAIFAH